MRVSFGFKVSIYCASPIVCRVVTITERTYGWGVFRLGACLAGMGLSAFDAVVRFSAVGLGMSVILTSGAFYYAILVRGASTRILVCCKYSSLYISLLFAAGSRSTKNIGSGSLLTLCLMFIIFLAVCP